MRKRKSTTTCYLSWPTYHHPFLSRVTRKERSESSDHACWAAPSVKRDRSICKPGPRE